MQNGSSSSHTNGHSGSGDGGSNGNRPEKFPASSEGPSTSRAHGSSNQQEFDGNASSVEQPESSEGPSTSQGHGSSVQQRFDENASSVVQPEGRLIPRLPLNADRMERQFPPHEEESPEQIQEVKFGPADIYKVLAICKVCYNHESVCRRELCAEKAVTASTSTSGSSSEQPTSSDEPATTDNSASPTGGSSGSTSSESSELQSVNLAAARAYGALGESASSLPRELIERPLNPAEIQPIRATPLPLLQPIPNQIRAPRARFQTSTGGRIRAPQSFLYHAPSTSRSSQQFLLQAPSTSRSSQQPLSQAPSTSRSPQQLLPPEASIRRLTYPDYIVRQNRSWSVPSRSSEPRNPQKVASSKSFEHPQRSQDSPEEIFYCEPHIEQKPVNSEELVEEIGKMNIVWNHFGEEPKPVQDNACNPVEQDNSNSSDEPSTSKQAKRKRGNKRRRM